LQYVIERILIIFVVLLGICVLIVDRSEEYVHLWLLSWGDKAISHRTLFFDGFCKRMLALFGGFIEDVFEFL